MRTFWTVALVGLAVAVSCVMAQNYLTDICRQAQNYRTEARMEGSHYRQREITCRAYGADIECAQEQYDNSPYSQKDLMWDQVKQARKNFYDYGCSGASSPSIFVGLLLLPAAVLLGRGYF